MKLRILSVAALSAALAACGGSNDAETASEPAPLELTPGAWAANETQASFADEDGIVLATMRCEAETGELLLELPGDFAEGVPAAMLLRTEGFMHGMDPVEVRETEDGTVRIGRMPTIGPVTDAIMGPPTRLTIEAQGQEPVMVETDERLQAFVAGCKDQADAVAPGPGGEENSEG